MVQGLAYLSDETQQVQQPTLAWARPAAPKRRSVHQISGAQRCGSPNSSAPAAPTASLEDRHDAEGCPAEVQLRAFTVKLLPVADQRGEVEAFSQPPKLGGPKMQRSIVVCKY